MHPQRHTHQSVETKKLVQHLVELSHQGEITWCFESEFDESWNYHLYSCRHRSVRFELRHRGRVAPLLFSTSLTGTDVDGSEVPIQLSKLAMLRLRRAALASLRQQRRDDRAQEQVEAQRIVAQVTAKQADLIERIVS